MPVTTVHPPTDTVRRSRRLPAPLAFAGAGLLLVVVFAAAGAPSPLFVWFEERWGFAPWLLTTAFAIYALTLLVALLVVGSLSDHVGRRPVVLGSLVLLVASLLLMASADGIGTVIAARAVQGLATGAVTAALSAEVGELAPPRLRAFAGTVTSVAPMVGLGIGALGTGIVETSLDRPVVPVLATLVVLLAVGGVLTALSRETVTRQPGALASLRPSVSVAPAARPTYLRALPTFVATWMTGGFYLGLAPSLLRDGLGVGSELAGAITITVLTGSGAVAVLATARVPADRLMRLGLAALLTGTVVVAGGALVGSAAVFFAGSAIAGAGFGTTFSAGLRLVVPLAATHERGALFAAIFVASYLAFGLPAIVAGVVAGVAGLVPTAVGYLVVVAVVAAVGVVTTRRA